MGDYRSLIEAYHKLFLQANQIFEGQLDIPIVFDSRVEGEVPLIVSSISSLYNVRPGVRLGIGFMRFMRVHHTPGWIRWDGVSVEHSEVFLTILKAADSGSKLTVSR
jgi:hypothetical protein